MACNIQDVGQVGIALLSSLLRLDKLYGHTKTLKSTIRGHWFHHKFDLGLNVFHWVLMNDNYLLFALCCRFLSSFEDLEGVLLFSLSYDHIFL
jgi:hypothetical protein